MDASISIRRPCVTRLPPTTNTRRARPEGSLNDPPATVRTVRSRVLDRGDDREGEATRSVTRQPQPLGPRRLDRHVLDRYGQGGCQILSHLVAPVCDVRTIHEERQIAASWSQAMVQQKRDHAGKEIEAGDP